IYGQTMRLMAATVLETFPNTTMGTAADRPGGADASAVRRAVAYIEDRAAAGVRRGCAHMGAPPAEPIGLAEIAAAARLGTRTVQEAFRRHLDTTPIGYLRRGGVPNPTQHPPARHPTPRT